MTAVAQSLSNRLRLATRRRHTAIEQLEFFRALRNHALPRQSVISYLRGLSVVHASLETALVRAAGTSYEVWRVEDARLPSLLSTLDAAGAARFPDIPHAVDAAIRLVDDMLVRAHRPSTLLGPLYVLEGSLLGGRLLRRHFAAALDVDEQDMHYCTSGRDRLKRRWATFKRSLDAVDVGEAHAQAIIDAAQATFDGIAALAAAAFPYDETALRHRVTAINPEAGRHAMPQSDAEIARALRCAHAAWSRWPYLEARYGERGRRFTLSDSCWLVSLYDADEATVVKSLTWLRGVLANRGLPTVILEQHLQLIDEDVRRDDPERAAHRLGFGAVIARFRAERDALLPESARTELTRRWQQRLDACPGISVASAAELLISAHIDTAAGVGDAWTPVRSWLCDAQRFSAAWITNVEGLARELESCRR